MVYYGGGLKIRFCHADLSAPLFLQLYNVHDYLFVKVTFLTLLLAAGDDNLGMTQHPILEPIALGELS